MKPYYDEDGITIYHADCLEILPDIDPADIDLLLTDPPYGIGLSTFYHDNGRSTQGGRHAWPAKNHPPVVGDESSFDPSHLLRFGKAVLFGANHFADKLPTSSSWIVWNRLSGANDGADAELAWSNLGGTVRMFSHMWTGYRRDSEIGFHVHPTQKPVALMEWILDRWTEPGDLILDPYMGSGPVAKACHLMGRRYIGVEIEERYCEIAVQRLAQGVLPL